MLFTIIAMGALVGFVNDSSDSIDLDDVAASKLVKITTDLAFCKVGSNLKIVEFAPTKRELVVAIAHEITCIAKYNRDTQQLVNLTPANYHAEQVNEVFTGLPSNLLLRGQYPGKVNGGLGFYFDVTAERPGVYIINSKWVTRVGGPEIACSPVIVTIVPKSNKFGRPILQPEWFKSPFDIE